MSLFNRATKQEYHALLACRDQGVLLSLFQKLLTETQRDLTVADDTTQIHRLQGRALFIKDFLEAVEESPRVLERLK